MCCGMLSYGVCNDLLYFDICSISETEKSTLRVSFSVA